VAVRGTRRAGAALAAALLAAATHGLAGAGTGSVTTEDGGARPASAGQPVTLTGRLHVIRNGELLVFLIDDRGVATRVLIDEPVMRAFGGTRGLDRKRVIIEGQRLDGAPEAVRVLSIQLEPSSR
jgi:hypothetical protein